LSSKEELLRWLEEDEDFRARLATLIMETPVLRELKALREDFNRLAKSVDENTEAIRALQKQMVLLQEQVAEHSKAIRALQEQVAEHSKAIRALQEQVAEHSKAIRALQEQVAEHSKAILGLQERVDEHSREIGRLRATIGALGRRWGLMSEEAFRAAMASMLDEFGFKVVGKLVLKDDWGIVDPDEPGALYEYDLCITSDGKEWVVEIKSHVDWEDVAILKRKIKLYERCRGTRPEVAIVSPSVEESARAKAEKAGIKVFTYEEEDTYLDLLH